MNSQEYFIDFSEESQLFSPYKYWRFELDQDDPVYTLIEVLEGIDYSELMSMYTNIGRKGYNPIMIFAVIVYANTRAIRSIDEIVEMCQRDLGFLYLTKGEKPKRDVFYNFINNKMTKTMRDNLHYQFINILREKGYIGLEKLYIDGTKIEANANRYTFVWRGSVNYHLVNLLDNISECFNTYNAWIKENQYDKKYLARKEEMFYVEGSEKAKEIIEENRKRKKKDKKKLSNNVILKINNIGPYTMIRMLETLDMIIDKEGISRESGRGKKKEMAVKLYDDIYRYGLRLMDYKEKYEIMKDDRNSYSKTDIDATFMRMKDDHMRNGQLKPAYNVQIGVENYFVVDYSVSQDRTDYNTLIPLVSKHILMTEANLLEVTADSGYCSESNLKFLKENQITPYIKTQEHEKQKTRKYHNDISKHFNMKREIINNEYRYTCADGRYLEYQETKRRYGKTFKVYACKDCQGCGLKRQCLYNYSETKDKTRNKRMEVNHVWIELKKETNDNIHTEKGSENMIIRSIQTEGTFGDMKYNDEFRQFNHRSMDKVETELFLYVFARNINKLHRFKNGKIKEYRKIIA